MKYEFDIALSFATEDQKLVEKVYHYLKVQNLSVFFAPADEAQLFLSGRNQREAFYDIFAIKSQFVALFVSKNYIVKEVPMEEANIAFSVHGSKGSVIPIYMDEAKLPQSMVNPKERNYFQSNNPAIIATHLAKKIRMYSKMGDMRKKQSNSTMNIIGNTAQKQVFVQTLNGKIEL